MWVSSIISMSITVSMKTSDVAPLIKSNINCATPHLCKTLNVNISCSLKRGSACAGLGTLPLRIRIILFCSIIKGDTCDFYMYYPRQYRSEQNMDTPKCSTMMIMMMMMTMMITMTVTVTIKMMGEHQSLPPEMMHMITIAIPESF